jgi:fructose-1,6-bisphosphatase II / sedoheptulose-1,7-bisphosphatase
MQGRLVLNKDEIIRAKKLGINDFEKKYNIDEIVKGDVIFCASGVTSGDLAKGLKTFNDKFEVTTLALHKSENINKTITNTHNK